MKCKLSSVIKDIAAGPFGSNLKVSCFVESGFPIIDGANLKGFRVTDDITKFVTEEKARSLPRSIAKRGDVVVTISGTLGQIAYIPEDSCYEEYLVSQRQFRVTFDEELVSVPYLIYYFHSREGQHKILSFESQVGVPALSQPLKNFKNIELELPPLETQHKIASILSSLDDKIELNDRINANLEEQARAIFKSWFVDNPFQVEKETTLGNVCRCELGGTPSRNKPEYWNGNIPWINSGEVNEFRITSPSEYITEEGLRNSSTKLLPAKTTVLAITGATLGQVSLLEVESCANQSVVGIVPSETLPYEFIYPLILIRINELMSHQTGGAQQHINKQNIEGLPVAIPAKPLLDKYRLAVAPLLEMIGKNSFENLRLSSLRDALLPRLLSGELDVSKLTL